MLYTCLSSSLSSLFLSASRRKESPRKIKKLAGQLDVHADRRPNTRTASRTNRQTDTMTEPDTSPAPAQKRAKMGTLEAVRYTRGKLEVLNQLRLPLESEYEQVSSVEEGWQVIKQMKVRGAPAIAIVGSLSVAVDLAQRDSFPDKTELQTHVCRQFQHLKTARPTAVNMSEAVERFTSLSQRLASEADVSTPDMKERIIEEAEKMLEEDRLTNRRIGLNGANHLLGLSGGVEQTVMTHCNTGSLATAGYGTALGVIRALHERGSLSHVYCTETRPYNQGARLTAYELVYEDIPSSLITDSMAAFCMLKKGVTAVVVGADRVVANGDTANKIGTYQLALAAKHHKIPFLVAAPVTSCDLSMESGEEIVIEERPHREMTSFQGTQIAAPGIGCWNPAFDVTPASLISGIITEHGVFPPHELSDRLRALQVDS